MDNIVVNLYVGGYVYFIADGYAYYLQADLLDDGRWFLLTHSDCLRDGNSDYCKGNPVYGRKAVKVEGVDSVLRLKLTHKPGATDESFATFAIDATGNIYQLNGNKATKYYGNNDVEDMISENEVILKDGTHKNIK